MPGVFAFGASESTSAQARFAADGNSSVRPAAVGNTCSCRPLAVEVHRVRAISSFDPYGSVELGGADVRAAADDVRGDALAAAVDRELDGAAVVDAPLAAGAFPEPEHPAIRTATATTAKAKAIDKAEPCTRPRAIVLRFRRPGILSPQPIEERGLGGDELAAPGRKVEPGRSVDLGEQLPTSGTRWPFQFELVAAHRVDVEIRLDRPGDHHFAVTLTHLAQLAVGIQVGGRGRSELLGELATRRSERVLVVAVLAFGNRPRAFVLGRPERTAHVGQQNFELAQAATVEQQAGASRSARVEIRHVPSMPDGGDI